MVSIIMAAYNAEKYINVAIESVLNQEYENWELLIVNDGSQDKTEQLVKAYDDSRIKYYKQENKGVSAARNVGLSKMSGDYFCFLDSDDYLPPQSLKIRYQCFMENPEFDYLDGEIIIFDKDLEKSVGHWVPKFYGNPHKELLKISESCFFNASWMIKRRSNLKYHFNEDFNHGEDLMFLIDISQNGGLYGFVDDVILHYRKGHDSAMRDLVGLEKGYQQIYNCIVNDTQISNDDCILFKKKAKRIILKSYLGNLQLKNAFLSLTRFW